jgi:hypothetical protein
MNKLFTIFLEKIFFLQFKLTNYYIFVHYNKKINNQYVLIINFLNIKKIIVLNHVKAKN